MALAVLYSLVGSLSRQDKTRFAVFSKWLSRLQNFDKMEIDAVRNIEDIEELNEKLESILNEKNNFLSEIELKESDLRIFMEKGLLLARDIADKTTLEEINPFIEKTHQQIFGDKTDFLDCLLTAIDKHTVPACFGKQTDKHTAPAC